jgi:hypothetical protein
MRLMSSSRKWHCSKWQRSSARGLNNWSFVSGGVGSVQPQSKNFLLDRGSTNPRSRDELTPATDAYNPLFACDCAFVVQLVACRLGPERFFFLWRLMLYWFIKSSSCARFRQNQSLSRHTANDRVCLTHMYGPAVRCKKTSPSGGCAVLH